MDDYDKLVKSLRYCVNNGSCSDKCPAWKVKDCRTVLMSDAADAIEVLTHADVVPVVHGKWTEVCVEDTGKLLVASMRCDQCGLYHNEVYQHGRPTGMAHYCIHCGAKMDGEP